jgi:hypothetical protein
VRARRGQEAHHLVNHGLELSLRLAQVVLRKALAQIALEAIRVVAEQDGAHAPLASRHEGDAEDALRGREKNWSVHGMTLFRARAPGAPNLAIGAVFPGPIPRGQTYGAWPVSGRAGVVLIAEEDAVLYVAAARDRA